MNILNKVTLQYLIKNKVRTLMTIIGIILSVSMITAVTTFGSSFYKFAYDNAVYDNGYWHGSAYNEELLSYQEIKNDPKIKEASLNKNIGYAYIHSQNDYKPYLYVMECDDLFKDMMSLHIVDGHYPTNKNEILLPQHLVDNGNVYFEIGDSISLDIGERVFDGYQMNQFNPLNVIEKDNQVINQEKIIVKQTKEYIVCGYYERPDFENYTAPGYSAIALLDDSSYVSSYDIHFTMKQPSNVYDYVEEHQYSGVFNSDVLLYLGVSYISSFEVVFLGLMIIIVLLIMIGSISLIYNAFSISVSERIKQYGLLSSIGATHKQIRKMVYFEAFLLALIGIPLGILAGIFGIGITLYYIGSSFIALGDFEIPMSLSISVVSIVAACMISIMTICISIYIPSFKATKVTAVEAIRQSKEIKESKKVVRTPKWIMKVFGVPAMLANKYYNRSKKKYRSTILSLVMSIVLFMSASSLTSYISESVEKTFNEYKYDLYYNVEGEKNEIDYQGLYNLFKNNQYVDDVVYSYDFYYTADIDERFISKEVLKYYNGDNSYSIRVSFIDDQIFKELLNKYHLNENDYYNKKNFMGLIYDEMTMFNVEKGKYVNVHTLNSEYLNSSLWKPSLIEGYEFVEEKDDMYVYYHPQTNELKEFNKYKVGQKIDLKGYNVVEEQEFYMSQSYFLTYFYPMSLMDEIVKDDGEFNYYMLSDQSALAYDELNQSINKDYHYLHDGLVNINESDEDDRNIVLIINVLSYGFIVLISCISAVNVFNTMTTNISLRKRDFAMLKSIGMSNKMMNKMLNYECILFGSRSLMIGIPLSIIVSLIIYAIVSEGFYTQFYIPIHSLIIAISSVFIVVYISIVYTKNKVDKESDVEVLKNENI